MALSSVAERLPRRARALVAGIGLSIGETLPVASPGRAMTVSSAVLDAAAVRSWPCCDATAADRRRVPPSPRQAGRDCRTAGRPREPPAVQRPPASTTSAPNARRNAAGLPDLLDDGLGRSPAVTVVDRDRPADWPRDDWAMDAPRPREAPDYEPRRPGGPDRPSVRATRGDLPTAESSPARQATGDARCGPSRTLERPALRAPGVSPISNQKSSGDRWWIAKPAATATTPVTLASQHRGRSARPGCHP